MYRARTGWVLALALAWAGLAQAATSGSNPDLADKQQALAKAGLELTPQELADKQASLDAARKNAVPAPAAEAPSQQVADPEPETQAPVDAFPLTDAERAEKLQVQRHWDMQESIEYKMANGLQLTPAEKQWVEDNTPSDPHKGPSHNTDEGGPDAFGNTWIMTGDEGGPAYFWIDIPEADRTYITLGDDNFLGPFDMGGVISYYGTSYNQIYIGSNGNIGFNSTTLGSLGNVAIPTAAAPNAILPILWDDMNPGTGGQVYYGTVDGDFVVTYDAVREYGGTGTFTVQVVFDFDNSDVYFNYNALVAPLDLASCTIGIENETGTDGLQVAFNNAASVPAAQTTIRFDLAPPPNYAMSITPTTAAITASPGDEASSQFTLFNSGLSADSYTLATTTGSIDYGTFIDGQPATNVGPLGPGESVVVDVLGTVPGDQPSGVDVTTVLVESVNSDNDATFTLNTTVFNAAFGGPDAFGNTWTSSAGGEVEYAWVDIPVESRTVVTGLTDDSFVGPFPLGGVVSYYGDPYTEIYVGSNGNLGFASASLNSLGNAAIPTAGAPNNILPFFWDDMNPASGGQVYYGTVDGDFVLTFDAVREFGGNGTLTAQVVFDFDNSSIYYSYAALVAPLDVASCTIGIENSTGTDGLQVIFNNAPGPPLAEWTIRFDLAPPADYAVSINPAAVNLSAGPAQDLSTNVTVFNSGLLPDSYSLSMANGGYIDWIPTLNGTPVNNTGVIQPLEGFTFQLTGTVAEDAPTITDIATLTVESDGMEGVLATAPVTTVIFNAAAGGPDAFGNTWISSAGGDQEYFFVTLEDATVVTLADNGVAGPFPLGGVLNWYGTPVNEFYIGANGVIGFNATNLTTTINTTLPTTGTPNGLIALFWDNMNPAASGTVSYGLDESDRLVVTFDDVAQVPAAAGNLTAQVVIDFSAGHIFCNYAQVEGLVLNSCTIGIENASGSDGLTVLFNGAPGLPLGEWTVRFNVPPPPDYWPSLQDGVAILGAADSEVTASMSVTNLGLLQDSFAITATADNGVEVDVLINGQPGVLTPVVQPNESYTFELELSIPEVPGSPTGTVTVTATSQGDGSLNDQTTAALTIVLVQGGPDAGGYFWSTSDADGSVEYEWVTIENPTVVTGFTDDSVLGPFDIGFPWTHYGNTYSQVHIASNGSIGFSPTGMNLLTNSNYPDAAIPNDMISFFWDDLNPATAGGVVSYGTQDGMFIVEFNQVFEFGGTGRITAQVILDTNEEAVRINYQTLLAPLDILSCTIGQENADGTMGFAACFNGTGWLPHDAGSIWFGPNVIGPSGPYAVRVTPDDVTGVGITGGYAEYEFEVENRGENPSAFSLLSEGNAWDVTYHDIDNDWAEITSIPEVPFDASYMLGVRVHVPAEPESFTDLLHFTVTSTEDETAWDDAQILTASSCSHTAQLTQNVSGNGLFGTEHLMDGDWVSGETMVWSATGVNRMVMENSSTGDVGTISVLPFGHDYMGIAHDSRDGTFWVSYAGGVTHVSATGSLIAAFSPPLLDVATGRVPTGLAFDADGEILWAICANGAVDEFVRIDVADAANPIGLNAVIVPWSTPAGSGSAGLDYNEGGDQLVALHTGTGTIECFLDLGDGTVDARGDFCPSGLVDAHGVALHEDGRLFIGWTSGLAHPVEEYTVPCAVTAVDRDALRLPTEFELGANYPNPFNPSTVIRYALPEQGMVRMDVYNLIGQHQQALVSGLRPAGYHEVVFEGGSRASGVYFYRLTVTDLQGRSLFTDAGKMILMK